MLQFLALDRDREHKIEELLPKRHGYDRFEASGVLAKGGYFYVIFDNLTQIARIDSNLSPNDNNVLLGRQGKHSGFEDITYNYYENRFYILIEDLEYKHGHYKAKVQEYDDDFNYLEGNDKWLDYAFESKKKDLKD